MVVKRLVGRHLDKSLGLNASQKHSMAAEYGSKWWQ